MKRGSALLMALWIILVLGVIVISFAFEAKLQGGINLYVQGKNRVKRMMEAGKTIGEVVIANYADAKRWEENEDEKELLEDDRWYKEKRALKYSKGCTIGPLVLDAEDPDSGTITVEITLDSSDESAGININKLVQDSNYDDRMRMILDSIGVPREKNFDIGENKTIGLQSHIIACIKDFIDDDDTRYDIHNNETGDGEGAEKAEYEEYYEDHKKEFADEDRFEPANCELTDIKELSRALCFRELPAILTGGVLNPWEDKENQIIISKGLVSSGLLSVTGDGKVNVNRASADQLLLVPGILDPEELDDGDLEESREVAEAIVNCRKIKPEDYDVPEDCSEWGYGEYTDDWWTDLTRRVSDEFDVTIDPAAKEYLTALPGESDSIFRMKIIAEVLDMAYVAECTCYVKDKKVRYTRWKEW